MTASDPIPPYARAFEKLDPSRLTSQTEAMGENFDVSQIVFAGITGREELQLRNATTAASIARTIQGASTLTLNVQDPGFAILNSKWLAGSGVTLIADQGGPTKTGVEFNQAVDAKIDGLWFRLVALELPAGTSPALTLTFEDREVALLRAYPKGGDPATYQVFDPAMTRIQVMHALIADVKEYDHVGGIRWVAPMWPKTAAVPQPIDATRRAVLHLPGLTSASGVTVERKPATQTQIDNLNAVLDAGERKSVPRALLVIGVMVVTQESAAQNLLPTAIDPSIGIFQQIPEWWPTSAGLDPTTEANAFYDKALEAYNGIAGASYGDIASVVQRPEAFLNGTDPNGKAYEQWRTEAEATVTAYVGDIQGVGGSNLTASSLSPFVPQKPFLQGTALFQRGSQDNQGGKTVIVREDNWSCLQRLASEVGWVCYCVSGTIYIEDYPHLFKQAVRFTVSPDTDGVTGIGFAIDTGKQRSQVTIQCRISRWGAPPGTVAAVSGLGPANGRWLIQTVQRDLFQANGTVTLQKPQTTLKDAESASPIQSTQVLEPSGTTAAQAATVIAGDVSGVRASIVAAAQKAVALQAADGSTYVYLEQYTPSHSDVKSLFPPPKPVPADCSSFVTLCYKAAGAPDPNKQGYSPLGDTGTLIAHGAATSTPQPGDLVFWGTNPAYPRHVALFIGDGNVITMGHAGPPIDPRVASIPDVTGQFNDLIGTYIYNLGPLG